MLALITTSAAISREIWLLGLCGVSALGLVWGLANTRRIIQAPFMFAAGIALILCPQVYALCILPARVPDEAFSLFCIMVLISSASFYLGYSRGGLRFLHTTMVQAQFDFERLFYVGLSFAIIGSVGSFQLNRLETISEWRGWPVYWSTLSKFTPPGVSLILLSYLTKRSWFKLTAALVFLLPSITAVVTYGRRSATLTLPFLLLVPIFLQHKELKLPRWSVIMGLYVAFVVAYGFPYWRDRFPKGEHVQVVSERPFSLVVEETFCFDGKTLEIVDSMLTLGAAYRTGIYDYGLIGLYNSLVSLYFPSSILGQHFKQSLMAGVDYETRLYLTETVYGITVPYYTAKSGFADLFLQFSFFGAAVLYPFGFFYRRMHDRATMLGDPTAVLFICFFACWPASISYGPVLYGWLTMLPQVAVMLISARWCVQKTPLIRSPGRRNVRMKHFFGRTSYWRKQRERRAFR